MSLTDQIQLLKTDWREIILKWIKKNKSLWADINENYNTDIINFKDILEIYPKIENIFRCFQYFDSKNTKVVILGQDPYINKGEAMGLCFSVDTGCKIPPSLKNSYNETDREEIDTPNTKRRRFDHKKENKNNPDNYTQNVPQQRSSEQEDGYDDKGE